MKKISKKISKNSIPIAMIIVFLSYFLFVSFVPSGFKDYDNDEVIIKQNCSNFVMCNSVQNQTSKKYTLSVKQFDGIVYIKEVTVAANSRFNMQITINSGRFKVVATDVNNLYLLSDSESKGQITTTLPAGTYKIKLVGDRTNVKFSYSF